MRMVAQTRRLTGRKCQCGGCGLYFTGMTAFEKHRTGAYGPDRRCMAPTEMADAGLVEAVGGWWTVPMSQDAIASLTKGRNSASEAVGDAELT